MPWHADVETREHVVLYDSRTGHLPLNENGLVFSRNASFNVVGFV